ncbi:MAG: aminopeptidase [Burkholderiaceae bacterium]
MKLRILLVAAALVGIAGCSQLGYYVQAAHGQFSLLSQARPIDDWLADPQASDKLKQKLEAVQRIRRFAVNELALPDNRSYTEYADLHRPYALWNVVATPALSMTPKRWCFPIAGCVDYRGYYSKDDAEAYAATLRREGYDVQVSGVPAYSTLGWFADPVLSTFIGYPEGEVARLIFHELAHQVAYAPGDSQFNESFATTVEETGVERWFAKEADPRTRAAYEQFKARKEQFIALLLGYRDKLEALYAGSDSDAEKLRRKAEIFAALRRDYAVLKESWGGYAGYDRWFASPLSNAHLALVATYHAYVPAFRTLLTERGGYADFYRSVKTLASLDGPARERKMAALTPASPAPAATTQAALAAPGSARR